MDGFLQVPMSNETFTLPNEFIEKLNTVINNFTGVGNEANRETNQVLLTAI